MVGKPHKPAGQRNRASLPRDPTPSQMMVRSPSSVSAGANALASSLLRTLSGASRSATLATEFTSALRPPATSQRPSDNPFNTFNPTPRDDDAAIRTIMGEARGEGDEGQLAVANVIRNRAIAGRKSPYDIVHQPHQFSAWSEEADYMTKIDPASPAYQSAARAWERAKAGENNVGFAKDYWAYKTIETPTHHRGRPTFDIGNHRFVGMTPFPGANRSGASEQNASPTQPVDGRWAGRTLIPERLDPMRRFRGSF